MLENEERKNKLGNDENENTEETNNNKEVIGNDEMFEQSEFTDLPKDMQEQTQTETAAKTLTEQNAQTEAETGTQPEQNIPSETGKNGFVLVGQTGKEAASEGAGSETQETNQAAQPETAQSVDGTQAEESDSSDSGIAGTQGAAEFRKSYMKRQKDKLAKKHKKSMNAYAKAICCAILCGAIAGSMVIGSFAIGKNTVRSTASIETNATKLSTSSSSDDADSTDTASDTEYTVSEITKQCKSSVVAITNQSVSEVQTMFGTVQQQSTGSGSGVIIGKNDTELLIATNYHVIEDAEELTVCFNDDENAVFTAKVKGTSEENDLAVIAIQLSDISDDVLESISIATIGDSTQMEVGDSVVAIGNALGNGQSVTTGIISAVDREVTIDDYTASLLQTDAAINPGNSGGALFNMKGELIGINSAKYASDEVEGMGFAIPMATAQSIIENLMNQETRDKLTSDYGYLSISGQDVSETVAEMYGIPQGVYVATAVDGGAAAKAGIEKGDIITKLNDTTITTIAELKEELQYYAAGEVVTITLQRNGDNGYEEKTVEVTLDNASEQSTTSNSQNSQSGQSDSIQSLPDTQDGISGYFR